MIQELLLKINSMTMEEIVGMYVQANKDGLDGDKEFAEMEKGDLCNLLIWRVTRRKSIEENNKMYKLLGVKPFDVAIGESDYSCPVDPKILDVLIDLLLV